MERKTPRLLLLDPGITDDELEAISHATDGPLRPVRPTRGDGWAAVPLADGVSADLVTALRRLPSVRGVVDVGMPYRLASRELLGEDAAIRIPVPGGGAGGAIAFGGRGPLGVIVGSRWAAAADSRFEILAPLLQEAGCGVFHVGRVTANGVHDDAPGPTVESLRRFADIADDHGLALSVEVWDASQISTVCEVADLVQIGSENMQDFTLLRAIGGISKPVLLRRGAGATVEEFLLAAEYILVHGNGRVILCESGIRTFDALDKPRFEINAVPLIKQLSHLPLVADPSQTAPRASAVPAMAKAAIAAGADGLVLEVGTRGVFDPKGTAIDIDTMRTLLASLRPIARAIGRPFETGAPGAFTPPRDPASVLRMTDRTLAQTIEAIVGAPADLEVVDQWRIEPPARPASPPLPPDAPVLARCTSYRMGNVRLSRNLSYVDLAHIDPTIAALLETKQLNLGQLFVDPRIEKLDFEFGSDADAGEIDETFRRCFPDELDELHPYVWRRYRAAIADVVAFVVIEALPVRVWERVLDPRQTVVMGT